MTVLLLLLFGNGDKHAGIKHTYCGAQSFLFIFLLWFCGSSENSTPSWTSCFSFPCGCWHPGEPSIWGSGALLSSAHLACLCFPPMNIGYESACLCYTVLSILFQKFSSLSPSALFACYQHFQYLSCVHSSSLPNISAWLYFIIIIIITDRCFLCGRKDSPWQLQVNILPS